MPEEIKKIANNLHACIYQDCKMMDTCLRGQIYSQRLENDDHFSIVNPNHCTKDSLECPHYKTWEFVTFAYGFRNLLSLLPPAIFNRVRPTIYFHLGEKPYYKKRKGEMPTTPEEQEFIISTITSAGFTLADNMTWFDRYEDHYRLK